MRVTMTLDFDLGGTDEDLVALVENVIGAVADDVGVSCEPSVQLEVDGELRDPDDPATGLLS